MVILTGAGMSADSGISTFRDYGGIWESYKISEVATPEAWARNPELVNRFYNARREQLQHVEPNAGHYALVQLEKDFDVVIVTQNVDDLHERAGSSRIIHLHGELRKVRSTGNPHLIYHWEGPLSLDDRCEKGNRLRPHIVWFGEEVPLLSVAAKEFCTADIVLIIGTSLQVYPAAGLIYHAPSKAHIYYIDPNPAPVQMPKDRLTLLPSRTKDALPKLVKRILHQRA